VQIDLGVLPIVCDPDPETYIVTVAYRYDNGRLELSMEAPQVRQDFGHLAGSSSK
jgi:hypothetical protein